MEARSVDPKYRHNTHISASMLRRGEKFDRYEWLVERSAKFAGTVRISFSLQKMKWYIGTILQLDIII